MIKLILATAFVITIISIAIDIKKPIKKMNKPNPNVHHPSHYNHYPMETIEMMERIFGTQKTIDWCIMTAFKYRMRMGLKDDFQQELEKEQWYLQKAQELTNK